MLCRILGHKPTKKKKVYRRKPVGTTRTIIIGARRCQRCGKWLPPFDAQIKSLTYAERKERRIVSTQDTVQKFPLGKTFTSYNGRVFRYVRSDKP